MSARAVQRKKAVQRRARPKPTPYPPLAVFNAAECTPPRRVVIAQVVDDDDTSSDAALVPTKDGPWGTLLCETTGE